jgi:hypothetical protein
VCPSLLSWWSKIVAIPVKHYDMKAYGRKCGSTRS